MIAGYMSYAPRVSAVIESHLMKDRPQTMRELPRSHASEEAEHEPSETQKDIAPSWPSFQIISWHSLISS